MIVRSIEFPAVDEQYPQFVAVLKDVYVSRCGLIFDRDFELIPEVNFNVRFWPAYTPVYGLCDMDEIARRELRGEHIEELPGGLPYVYAVHYFGFYVFGHLWDTLQPLMKIESAGPGDAVLLVNPDSGHVNQLHRHFDLAGYDAVRRREVNTLTRVPELWYPSVVCYPGRVTPEGRAWLYRKYVEDNPAQVEVPASTPASLYLSRNDPRGRMNRRVANHDEVASLLKEHGFHVLDGSESLDEHIRLFRNARRITGPHGSMFRNVLFSGPDCKVLEFCSDRRFDNSLLEVGEVCGVDYQLLEVPGDEDNNISMDLEMLDRWLHSAPTVDTRS